MKIGVIATVLAVAFLMTDCSALGLLRGLGLFGNPLVGCGCGSPPYGFTSGIALSKTPSLGLGYPSTCCLSMTKPCLFTKLLLLKKKLLEKKMSLLGSGCKCGCGCGQYYL